MKFLATPTDSSVLLRNTFMRESSIISWTAVAPEPSENAPPIAGDLRLLKLMFSNKKCKSNPECVLKFPRETSKAHKYVVD